MSMVRPGQVNFSKGVFAPHLEARTDVAAYNSGLRTGENIVVLKTGGFVFRPGFRYIADALDPEEWPLPFQFSDEQPYVLAMGRGYMQPMTGGGVVLEDELAITSATNANPVVLGIAFHSFSVGDVIYVTGVEGMTEINGREWTVSAVPDDSHVAINANGNVWGVFTAATGGETRTEAPDPVPAPPAIPDPYVPPEPPPVYGGGQEGVGSGRHVGLSPDEQLP